MSDLYRFRSVFVYIILAALSERFSAGVEQVCCLTEFLFGEGFFYRHTQALAVMLQRKYCLRFVYGQKMLLSIANSTSKCSAQNLGSKVTNRRRGSFSRGHDQRSRFQFLSNMYCLAVLMSLVVYENTLPSFVLN